MVNPVLNLHINIDMGQADCENNSETGDIACSEGI